MATSLVDAGSLLVVDVGSVSTRAVLFDVVAGRFRFLASGSAPTTAGAPYHNVSEGVRLALDRLQNVVGRRLIGADEQLIIPSASDGSGVDKFAATISAGTPLKVVAVGLLEDVSLESARRLAMTTYSRVVQSISLNDRRRQDARINTLIRLRPDLVLVAGGTDNGASQSVLKLLEPVGLACYLLPEHYRPDVLFVGNKALREEVKSSLRGLTTLHFAPNIRPTLEFERLDTAQSQVARVFNSIRSRQIPGVEELDVWSNGKLLPTSSAFGRVVRFDSKLHSNKKGVLGVDVGASATTIAAAFDGDLTLGVYPQYGLGYGSTEPVEDTSLEEISRWLVVEVPNEYVREYLANKACYPSALPVTAEDMAIEQALARVVMQNAVRQAAKGFPAQASSPGEGLLPWVEPILATGSVLTQAPSLAQSALMLLDGLQPVGVTTLVLDQNHIASALGAAAAANPLLVVQILDSNSFLYLGTAITPVGNARPGTPVLRLKLTYEGSQESSVEVKQGSLQVLALPQGQKARLQLWPLHGYDVGMGASGRGGSFPVTGGALGIIIDARGRPLALPADTAKRRELFKKWLAALGGL